METVSIRAVFERFPAAIKGALLLRGADGLPHQVRFEATRAAELGGGPSHSLSIEAMVLEVAPTQDTFVPFELPTMEIAAGWYRLECEVVVDGSPAVVHPGDRFLIPWPRGAVRRGSVTVGTKSGGIALESLECVGDSMCLTFAADATPTFSVTVDGRPRPVLGVEFDADAGRGRLVTYPALRTNQTLVIQPRGEEPVTIDLP